MTAAFAPIDLARCAIILDELSHEIEQLGEALCADPTTIAAHIGSLQQIDRIAQHQRGIAALLKAGDGAAAIHRLDLEELKDRLLAR